MEPAWDSSSNGIFFCHMTPLHKQNLLELKYTVNHEDIATPLHKGTLKVVGNDQWEKKGMLDARLIFTFIGKNIKLHTSHC